MAFENTDPLDALSPNVERADGAAAPRELPPMGMASSLRAQVVLLLAFATLPVGVLAVAQGLAAFIETRELRQTEIAQKAMLAGQDERGALQEAFGALSALDPMIDMDALSSGSCNAMMRDYVEAKSELRLSFAGVFGADGALVCGYPFAPGLTTANLPEYQAFVENPRRTVTAYARGAISKAPVVVASAPIYRDEAVAGSIAVSLPSRYLNWGADRKLDDEGEFALVNHEGVSIGFENPLNAMDWLPPPEEMRALLEDGNPSFVHRAQQGQKRVYAATPLFEKDIYAVASWPKYRLDSELTWRQLLTVVLPIVMWAMAVGVAYYAVDRFALRHVLYLDRLVSAYGRTQRRLRAIGVREAPREFAQLGLSFDEMAAEIEHREDALRETLEEKDVLLKEVYHRVKNNLQLIISLMNLQLRDARDDSERDSILRLQDRVHGLATVHQKLYEAESLNAVRIDSLIRDIATNAKGARGPDLSDVALQFDMMALTETPDRALPLALFATEAIANAFKHALVFGTRGWLRVRLRPRGEGQIALEISNEMSGNCPKAESGRIGIGTQLIDGFTRQLRGEVHRECADEAFTISLVFPESPATA